MSLLNKVIKEPKAAKQALAVNSAPILVATDRCDRGHAPAMIRAIMPFGMLLFCAHDARKHEGKLLDLGGEFFDTKGRMLSLLPALSDR